MPPQSFSLRIRRSLWGLCRRCWGFKYQRS